jgi:HK97 family phage major capsid protein
MAPVYEPPKTRDGLRRFANLPRESRDSERSSLSEFRAAEGIRRFTSTAPHESEAWWRYATAKFDRGELDLAEQRALSRASGAAGNFLVPTDLEEAIVEAARAESAIARLASEFVTDSGSSLSIPTAPFGGTASWVAENALVTPSDPSLGEVLLAAHKSATRVIVSEELARDARVRFDEYLAGEIGRRLGVIQGQSFATGSGVGQPQGLAPTVAAVTAAVGSSTAFKLADIVSVYRALPAQYRSRASWLVNPDDYASLGSLVDSGGGLVLPSLQSAEPSLLGAPVLLEPYLPTPAANARSIIFGDVKACYAVRRVSGVSVQRLEEIYSDNGQLGYRARERVDGRVVLADACRALAHSAT